MAQSLLATDGYKFSMAEAGWPLRTETFHYSQQHPSARLRHQPSAPRVRSQHLA
jgi:nicotinate phosphoribosyltransferase